MFRYYNQSVYMRYHFVLTCPVLLKAEDEVEPHHDESVERYQSNVHLQNTQNYNRDATSKQKLYDP